MKRCVVQAASALLAASLLIVPALAGDAASFNPLGFSEDGRYFAFEEFGIQDGSGFPYSTIYAIDLPADSWVAGVPFASRLDTDGATLADARQEAVALAGETLGNLALSVPAELIALNGDGEADDGKALRFGPPGYDGIFGVQNPRTLALGTFPLTATGAPCGDYTSDPVLGFVLELDGIELHRDKALPRSRGCALDYRIYAVVVPFQQGAATPGAVVIVSVYTHGFEGWDRRFLAVPITGYP